MKRFKNILLFYDGKVGTDAALARAQTLARSNGARLTIVEVIERIPGDLLSLLGPLTRDELDHQERYIAERKAQLERLALSLCEDGLTVGSEVLRGTPFLEVIRKVLRDDHDLVVMTADSRKGLREVTFGSTSMHLMRKCPCPVWVMNPKAGRRFQHILAAVDPPVAATANKELDVKILQLASSLSRMEGCELEVLHAWELTGRDLDTSRSEITDRIKSDLITRNKEIHQGAVDRLLADVDLSGTEPNINLPRGEPWAIIPRFAREQAVDLIVMGTVTRTGIAGFFMGDTAEHVLQQVDCSVLAIKPEGFQTPVKLEDSEQPSEVSRAV